MQKISCFGQFYHCTVMGQSHGSPKHDENYSETILDTLPPEIILQILNLLSFDDLKSVVLVCKRWRLLGEDPSLWAGYTATYVIGGKNQEKKLGMKRLEKIEHIDIRLISSCSYCTLSTRYR